MTPLTFFNRRWWWVTPIVIVGVILLARLGFWQIDRLEQRRTFNNKVYTAWIQDPYDITTGELPDDLDSLEYRRVQIGGEYDYDNQIMLKNQSRADSIGVNLVTPLVLDDGRAVLVARGWIPQRDATVEKAAQYDEASDDPIIGLIQESQLMPSGQSVPIPDEPTSEWFYVNVDAIQPQVPYELLPIFILQLPEEGRSINDLPFRDEPLRLHEGNHLSYAVQWFSFALILGIGYILFVRIQEQKLQRLAAESAASDARQEQADQHLDDPFGDAHDHDEHDQDLTPAHQS